MNGSKLKIINLFMIIFFNLPAFSSNIFDIKNEKNVQILIGKCKYLPSKIIEVSSKNSNILYIEKDMLSNKLCLKGKTKGFTKVIITLFDGGSPLIWNIQVTSPSKKGKNNTKNTIKFKKNVSFDKDLKIPHKLPGWK